MIDNGFGGKDETLMQEHFEALVGSSRRAGEMSYLWSNSYPQGKLHTKEDIFEKRAKSAGFTDEQIEYFYSL
jgi:hypothetical protein